MILKYNIRSPNHLFINNYRNKTEVPDDECVPDDLKLEDEARHKPSIAYT